MTQQRQQQQRSQWPPHRQLPHPRPPRRRQQLRLQLVDGLKVSRAMDSPVERGPTFGACCQWEEGRVSASYIKAFNWDWNWEHKCSQATGTTIDGVNASSCVCVCIPCPSPSTLLPPASFVCWNFVCIVTGRRARERKN